MIRDERQSGLLSRFYDWFAKSEQPETCDVIFVLAGRDCRKSFAVRLLEQNWSKRLLLSVDRFEIRRFCRLPLPVSVDLLSIASRTEPRQRHYFVEIEGSSAEVQRIPITRLGTWTEIKAFSDWLSRNPEVHSVMIVSSGYHLRRVRLCCRRLLRTSTKLTFVAVPEESRYFRRHWWRTGETRRLVLSELLKTAVYGVLGWHWENRSQSSFAFLERRGRMQA